VTQSEFDSVETRHQIAAATVLEARTMLGYTRVEAPFDGLISRQLANAGDLASPGKPLLELESKAGLRFEADVAEALVGPIRIGDPLSIAIDGIETSLQGAVAEISPAANPLSRTVPIKLDLPPNPSLRAGQFGRLSLPVATSSNILVPARSVIKRGQMEIVFVADAGKAVMRLVKTGRRHGEQIEILSGIENREKVVASGHQTLRDGQPIVTP